MDWIIPPQFSYLLPQSAACRVEAFLVAQQLEGVVNMGVRYVVEVHKIIADPPQIVHSREDGVFKIRVLSICDVPHCLMSGQQVCNQYLGSGESSSLTNLPPALRTGR